MSEITIFNYGPGMLDLRTRLDDNGDPWFVAKDVCDILGFRDAYAGVRGLDDDEKDTRSVCTPGGDQMMTLINESGLYSLILRSRKPEAKQFKKWVTSEVLPSIRKKGGYMVARDDESPAEIMARALRIADDTIRQREERIEALNTKVEQDAPKLGVYERTMAAKGVHTVNTLCIRGDMSSHPHHHPSRGSPRLRQPRPRSRHRQGRVCLSPAHV